MSTSLLDMVVHYQRKVERSNDEEKILHCFSKLQKLPITVEVLSQTGVGKTVNAFRRDPGPVGETSRKLVAKWKDIFEENEKRLKRLKAEKEAALRAERERSRAGERGHDKERHRNRERERSRERSREPSEGRSREQSEERSREHSAERSASPADSEASDRMEVDEARALEEQARADADAEAEAEAEAARQAEAERRAKDEEKRRRREERARREAEKNGVVVKEEHKSHSSRDKHSSSDKHRKESKHRKHDPPLENGHSEPLFAVVKEEKSDHRHNGRAEGEKSHHSSHHHRSKHGSSSGHSSGDKHASPDEQYTPSEKHHSSSEKRSSSEKHSSKDKSRGDEASSSKSHHKSRSNGALEASHSSSSSKKSSHADSETDASREARRSKHKSKRDKHEKRSSKSEKKEDKKPVKLREVDFLCQPGGNDSDADQGGSFADALGGSDATPKKKKKKSKSSLSSHAASSSSAASAVPTYIPTRVADLPRPPPPPPAMEVLDALPEISATYRPLPRPAAPAAAPARPAAKRALDEDEALKAVLAGKNKRTKVYSGARSTGLSRVPTLLDICLRCLMENIDNVEQTGGVPYEILRTVLEKCTANQLSTIEYYNPYLLEDTDVLWEALVKKEFKCERREEMETWREMYARCSEEREQKYNKLRSMIEGKRKESLASSRKTKVAYEHTVAKPPRNIARKQAKHGTAVAASMPAPTVLAGGGSRPPRPAPGTDPTSRPAAPNRAAAPPKKKAPLMAKVLRAMGRR